VCTVAIRAVTQRPQAVKYLALHSAINATKYGTFRQLQSGVRCHPGTLTLRAERQSARMSKIINDWLTRPVWRRMLYSCTHAAALGVKGF